MNWRLGIYIDCLLSNLMNRIVIAYLSIIILIFVQLFTGAAVFLYFNCIFIVSWFFVYIKRLDVAYFVLMVTSFIYEIMTFEVIGTMNVSFAIAVISIFVLSERFQFIRREDNDVIALFGIFLTQIIYITFRTFQGSSFEVINLFAVGLSIISFFFLSKLVPLRSSSKLL